MSVSHTLPLQVSRPGGGLPSITIRFRKATDTLIIHIKQKVSGDDYLFVPRTITQTLKDSFDGVTVSNGTWSVPGQWSIDNIHEVPDIISEMLERRGWLVLDEQYDGNGGRYKMRARRDGPTTSKKTLRFE